MLKKFQLVAISILIFLFAINGALALSKFATQKFGYKYCNHHKFTFLLLKIYDSYLCTNDKKYFFPEVIFKTNFSLIINYDMNFDKEELSKSSIEEINRYYNIDKNTQRKYFEELLLIFPNVKKGDIIEAKYHKKGVVSFYHNKSKTGEIINKDFAKIFLNIWLHKDNKYQKMTKDLFKNDSN